MPISADYRKILNKEQKIYSIIMKSFKNQEKFLNENAEELYTKYQINISIAYNYLSNVMNIYPKKDWRYIVDEEPLGGFRAEMGVNDMIYDIQPQIEKATEKGYKKRFRILQRRLLDVPLIYNEYLSRDYADKRGLLQLSNYKGTISHTTKYDIINTLKEGLDNNKTRGEVAKDINKVNERIFSKARARTIAVSEIGKAYEYGNNAPMQQVSEMGYKVKKKRLTCRDAKVREEHRECEEAGRVDLNYIYPSVGVDIPPGGVNCRCTIEYDLDL